MLSACQSRLCEDADLCRSAQEEGRIVSEAHRSLGSVRLGNAALHECRSSAMVPPSLYITCVCHGATLQTGYTPVQSTLRDIAASGLRNAQSSMQR